MQDTRRCLNCNADGRGNFCQNCGQKLELTKIQFKEIISEFIGTVFNLDAPFLKTFKSMMLSPGEMVRSFLAGKRKAYYAPIRYLILCVFINILITKLIGFDPIENQKLINPNQNLQNTPSLRAGQFLSQYINFFTLILPFIYGAFSKLFFWKTKSNYAESVVLGFFVAAQYIIIALIPVLLSKLNPNLFLLNYLIGPFFFAYCFYHFHQINNKFVRFAKSLFAAFLTLIIYFALSYYIAFWIIKYTDLH